VVLVDEGQPASTRVVACQPEEEDVIEYRDDRLTFATILRAVPPEMLASLATKRRRLIGKKADGRSAKEPTVDFNRHKVILFEPVSGERNP
jgi:hypothetical protein